MRNQKTPCLRPSTRIAAGANLLSIALRGHIPFHAAVLAVGDYQSVNVKRASSLTCWRAHMLSIAFPTQELVHDLVHNVLLLAAEKLRVVRRAILEARHPKGHRRTGPSIYSTESSIQNFASPTTVLACLFACQMFSEKARSQPHLQKDCSSKENPLPASR
jgi:hypothetical protein